MFFSESDLRKILDWLKLHSVRDTEFKPASLPLNGFEKLAIVLKGENRAVSLYSVMSKLEGGLQYEVIPLLTYLEMEEKNPTTLYFCLNKIDNDDEEEYTEISKLFLGNHPISPTTDSKDVVVANKSLYEVLGVRDSSSSSTNAVTPTVSLYNAKSNIFLGGVVETPVEYGSMVINKANPLKAVFAPGSSEGIDGTPVFKITKGNEEEIVNINNVTTSVTPKGYLFTGDNPEKSYYVGVSDKVKLEFTSNNNDMYITTVRGNKTVTRTSYLNVIAENLLTANKTPYVIDGPKVITSKEDYPSKNITTAITYIPFKYMYIHRSTTPFNIELFGGVSGKQGYLLRRVLNTSAWTINSTTSTNQYYAVLIPAELTLSDFYTTFLGNDSKVEYTELGTVVLDGATSIATAPYKVYSSKLPVAFGDGTMTFKFK